jgi:hypothetical protein
MTDENTVAPSAPAADTPAPTETTGAQTPIKTETPAALEPAANPEAELDADLSKVWDDAQSADEDLEAPALSDRDERGRFKSNKPAEAGTETQDPPGETKPEPEPTAPAIEAPISWSAEAKAKWNALPPDTQRYIAERESAAHKAITTAGQRLKQYEPIDQLVNEYRHHFERHKVSPPDAFRALVQAQDQLDKDPVAGLVQIGLSYGVDLRPILGVEGGLPTAGSDPAVARMQARIDQLEAQASEQRAREQQASEARQQREQFELQSHIAEFSKGKPYFGEVKNTMAALLRSGQAEDLSQAYDMAIHAVPSVRQRIQADQRRAEDDARMAAVAKAKRAASVNTRTLPATTAPRSVDDELADIAARHYG